MRLLVSSFTVHTQPSQNYSARPTTALHRQRTVSSRETGQVRRPDGHTSTVGDGKKQQKNCAARCVSAAKSRQFGCRLVTATGGEDRIFNDRNTAVTTNCARIEIHMRRAAPALSAFKNTSTYRLLVAATLGLALPLRTPHRTVFDRANQTCKSWVRRPNNRTNLRLIIHPTRPLPQPEEQHVEDTLETM